MDNTIKSPERWEALSTKYKNARNKKGSQFFSAGRLAIHLQEALATACGCEKDVVSIYCTNGNSVTKVESGWDAVVGTSNGWTFGIGVRLEIAPNAFPKQPVCWLVRVEFEDDKAMLAWSDLSDARHRIEFGDKYEQGLKNIADKMYHELSVVLDQWIADGKPPAKLGFM